MPNLNQNNLVNLARKKNSYDAYFLMFDSK